MNYETSESLFEKSKHLVPGGVHSPVRSFKGMNITPRFFKSAKGAYITEVNGKEYIDFCMSFGPLILGHQDQDVKNELAKQLENGWSYGACEPYSVKLLDLILSKNNFLEQMRFMSSGTEAVMTAIRLARGATGKDKIIKFDGCYHGHTDSLLIKAGSGLAGTADASSKGVPHSIAKDTLICPLNDLKILGEIFKNNKGQIAAVIIEPLPANNGLLIQEQSYLEGIRKLCDENETLLIFDEVISGFRVGFGGMAKETNIKADIVTYGKIIGGGLPVGAVGASKKIMENLAPVGGVYQAGTLSANPLAMVGGYATLSKMTDDKYDQITKQTEEIVKVFNYWLNKEGHNDVSIIQKSSLFWLIPSHTKIKSISEIPSNLVDKFNPVFYKLIDKGIYLAPNAYEVGFVSLAHNQSVINDLKKKLGV